MSKNDGKYFGLSKPIIGKWTADGTYDTSTIFQNGAAMSTTVTPNYNEATLYGDNVTQEYVKEFSNADVEVGVTAMPLSAASVVFGHSVTTTAGSSQDTVNYNAGDSANYVGYGFVVAKQDGSKKYSACFLKKVKFTEGADSYTTKGDGITFSTPTISGKAVSESDGGWKVTSPDYQSETDAYNWILTQMGSGTVYTYNAVTPEGTENPKEEGWYVRSGAEGSYVYHLTDDEQIMNGTVYYERS